MQELAARQALIQAVLPLVDQQVAEQLPHLRKAANLKAAA
jgi:hypothetical protein